ncbi:hypothetical protein AN957_22720 [Cytobacillus solani]|uniref:Uncharacterized protein n=1 Tax=Cytobacillus solani TaxID=1637975 RepID=A0A0Q3VJ80_9BACI|nr:hypothetical protein AMS60_16885 [Bacillus sp. FJAT-21945]KQL21106.1 hypothetical protein AN957_22720 [Cytobacillus solani]
MKEKGIQYIYIADSFFYLFSFSSPRSKLFLLFFLHESSYGIIILNIHVFLIGGQVIKDDSQLN